MKKKITPEDLDLNAEILGKSQTTTRMTETLTCGYDCNTNPTVGCKTIEADGCLETDACWTIEPECETRVGCYDSNSHAQLCCPITNQNTCKNTVDNCVTNATCGANTVNICLVTQKTCAVPMTQGDDCEIPIISANDNCVLTKLDNKCNLNKD